MKPRETSWKHYDANGRFSLVTVSVKVTCLSTLGIPVYAQKHEQRGKETLMATSNSKSGLYNYDKTTKFSLIKVAHKVNTCLHRKCIERRFCILIDHRQDAWERL